MLFIAPTWRPFQAIHSDSESAFVGSACLYSLSTLEATCDSGYCGFALVERREADAWRWALIAADGTVVREGEALTVADAKRAAVETMRRVMDPVEVRGNSDQGTFCVVLVACSTRDA